MNKITVAIVGMVLSAGMVLAATVTNRQGQVSTTTSGSEGVTTTITIGANGASSVTSRTVNAIGAQIDAAAFVDATLFTPRNYGDVLIGITTGKVWVATGLTTNDWKILN